MPERMTVKQVLRDAADLIENTGWCQNALARDIHGDEVPNVSDPDVEIESYCMVGSICSVACENPDLVDEAIDVAAKQLMDWNALPIDPRFTLDSIGKVSLWNDRNCYSPEQVVSVLRRIADEAEKGEHDDNI